ncbi:hypothetical protein KC19_4G130600 [Ceratodon purpureus]|uniref:Exostosin GT47 domain-containing protein n=1 Tax=Ceratodon purpureus TaxID=3225 RepID=A0A8T0IA48_CERPU|nr:hypothetical protein KC19_4G130600 [Ceratodon purpureus]
MKFQGTLSLAAIYFFIVLAIFACISSFYRLNSYLSTPSWYTITDSSPLSLSMPDGNCSCTLAYLSPPAGTSQSEPAKVPALSCNCNKSTADVHLQGGNGSVETSSTEVKLECPLCPPRLHTMETVEVAKPCPGVPWYAEGKEWHSPPKFPLCSMDACFDYSRCDNMTEPLVFTYDLPSPPHRFFGSIKKSKYWTGDPEKACLFFVFLDTQYPWPVWPKDLPHWNGGVNHVLITFADKWENRNPPSDSIGNASIMGTIVYQTTNRAGFDISIPLPGKAHITELQSVHPLQRKYFATFRGTRYLGENGDGVFRSFDSFRGMHNGDDVVVATSCRHGTNDLIRKERPHLGINCDEDAALYAKYDFADLMNTTFGLVPAGRQPNSFRFIEVLSAGAIPVLIADNYVKPFDTLIHWHECLLQFPTSQMLRIIPALRAFRPEGILKRQENCLRIYNGFLKDDDTLLDAAMQALKTRFMGVIPSFAHNVSGTCNH